MKKLLLLCTFLLVFLMGGCAKKDYNCNLVMSREDKVDSINLLFDSANEETRGSIMNTLRTAKDCRRDDDIAAKEYYEWIQVINEVNKERLFLIYDIDDFIDNYDGSIKNAGKFLAE